MKTLQLFTRIFKSAKYFIHEAFNLWEQRPRRRKRVRAKDKRKTNVSVNRHEATWRVKRNEMKVYGIKNNVQRLRCNENE